MKLFNKSPFEKEYKSLLKKEIKYLKKQSVQKDNLVNKNVKDKVPENLEKTLDTAFEKAFILVFNKGTKLIEKTYNKEKVKEKHITNKETLNQRSSKKNIKNYLKTPNSSNMKNILFTGISSTTLGVLGIGLPDIPLFISLIIKNLQEISLSYGFEYKEEKEKIFMLMIVEGALSHDDIYDVNSKINQFVDGKYTISFDEQIQKSATKLSMELLYLKFLQGIPIIGSVSGFYDSKYMKQISDFAKLKYQQRFLKSHIK